MQQTAHIYRFRPFYLPTVGVERLSWEKHSYSNGQQPYVPGTFSAFTNAPFPESVEDWQNLGLTLTEQWSTADINRIEPLHYNSGFRQHFWYQIPSNVCLGFVCENKKRDFQIHCTRPGLIDRWTVNIRIREGVKLPLPLLAIWPMLQAQ